MQVAITKVMQEMAEKYRDATGHWPVWYQTILDASKKKARSVGPRKEHEDFEGKLLQQIRADNLPEPKTQYRWWPGRRFAADFAYPDLRILIEVQGGIYLGRKSDDAGGRHNRGAGYEADREKVNEAKLQGWIVLEFGPTHVRNGLAVRMIARAIAQAQKTRPMTGPT